MILFYIYNLYEYDYQYLNSNLLFIRNLDFFHYYFFLNSKNNNEKYYIRKKESNVRVFQIAREK